MIKQSIKQAWGMLRANPLISSISIAGTALSIAMIMVVVLVYQIDVAGYAPESYRHRMLYINAAQASHLDGNSRNRGGFSAEVGRECFYALEIPETATLITSDFKPVSLSGKRLFKEYSMKYTDAAFWRVFDFTFQQGRAFSEAEFSSGMPVAVVCEQTARELFGTRDVVGEIIVIDFMSYAITGVVKDVSKAASDAYGQIWMPYTSNKEYLPAYNRFEGMTGAFNACILAKKSSDFPLIRAELQNTTARYNSTKTETEINFMHQPITVVDRAKGSHAFKNVEWRDFLMQTGGLLLFLLLVPALNLTGVAQSSIQQRKSEIGVRKTFGATFPVLIRQILYENFVMTMIGGAVGFFLSFLILMVGKNFLLGEETMLNANMLFKPSLFILALFFILLLNVLSALIPAIRIARQPAVDAMKGDYSTI